MVSQRLSVILQLVVLWLIVIVLAVVTAMAAISSSSRADCPQSFLGENTSSAVNITLGSRTCSRQEDISEFVHHYTSYLQSVHIVIIQAAVGVSLLVFKPALRAMIWTTLDVSSTLGALQRSIELASSPSLVSGALYVRTLHSVPPFEVIFVLLITALSIFSPFAISAVYRSHDGPHTVSASLIVGGGVGPILNSSLSEDAAVGGGIVAGRALLNARTISNTPTANIGFAPFVPEKSILGIRSTQVETAVARQTLDCGPSAPMRVWSSNSIVTIDPTYFSSNLTLAEISFAGQSIGFISNDPHVSTVYINATTAVAPGSVETQSTVIFLAANGTMEGAQQRINSTTPSSRIAFVDVLVCTSTARLEISQCNIERGVFSSCHPPQTPRLSGNASMGGVDAYVKNPISTSIALSASPVMACYQLSNRLPMWNYITAELIAAQLPPLSFLSSNIPAPPYSVPLTYVTNALFRQTAQALVQGMTNVWQVYSVQPVQLTAVFATSAPILLHVIMGMVALCAMTATYGSMTTRRHTELDASQLIYISRCGNLAKELGSFMGDDGELLEDAQKLEVRYAQNHYALALAYEAKPVP